MAEEEKRADPLVREKNRTYDDHSRRKEREEAICFTIVPVEERRDFVHRRRF